MVKIGGPSLDSSISAASVLHKRAVERKRESNKKQKWSPKWAHAGNPPAVRTDTSGKVRPAAQLNKKAELGHRQTVHMLQRNQALNKLPRLNNDESDCEQDIGYDLSRDRTNDTDFIDHYDHDEYSHDATLWPALHGQQAFEQAVDDAVERFEDDQTTKLVKEEYEVLDHTSEIEEPSNRVSSGSDEDDDFELI